MLCDALLSHVCRRYYMCILLYATSVSGATPAPEIIVDPPSPSPMTTSAPDSTTPTIPTPSPDEDRWWKATVITYEVVPAIPCCDPQPRYFVGCTRRLPRSGQQTCCAEFGRLFFITTTRDPPSCATTAAGVATLVPETTTGATQPPVMTTLSSSSPTPSPGE